jgi:hypothetical protein
MDFSMYLHAARRWLDEGGFYLPHQLAGPYEVAHLDVLYPPFVLILLIPFMVLPAFLWWAVPLGALAIAVVHHRPDPLVWPLLAFCVAFPPVGMRILTGNPFLWAAAAVALGTIRWWPAVGVLLKPSLAPFALLGVTRRSWWIALALLAAVNVPFAPMWPDYLVALRNAQHPFGPLYSVLEVPLLLLPIVAYLNRTSGHAH